MKFILINAIIMMTLFTGCAEQTSYHIMHNLKKNECAQIVNPDERQSCLKEHSKSYGQYQSEHSSEKVPK